MKMNEAAALYGLGLLSGNDIVATAKSEIAAGRESDSLYVLSALSSPAFRDAAPLFESALAELGLAIPKGSEALTFLVKFYAQEIITGTLTPEAGCLAIAKIRPPSSPDMPLFMSMLALEVDLSEILMGYDYASADFKKRKDEQLIAIRKDIIAAAKRIVSAA